MADFEHEVTIAADPETVRRLLTERPDLWWTSNAVIDASPGGVSVFRFPVAGFHAAVRINTNKPGLVEWSCFDSETARSSGFKNLHDWVGSTIRFEITAKGGGQTELRLRHVGLGESAEYYRNGFNVWGFYMDSLKAVAEGRQGSPYQGGPPGARTFGMLAFLVPFTVREGEVEAAKHAIDDFVSQIEAREAGGTVVYRSYQQAKNEREFVHYMVFRDAAAHQAHLESPHRKAFVAQLYPLCERAPQAQPLTLGRESALD
jgi:quinol monooxygenase YgiN/uncharacterized protein YndB with AHSA1/START domain